MQWDDPRPELGQVPGPRTPLDQGRHPRTERPLRPPGGPDPGGRPSAADRRPPAGEDHRRPPSGRIQRAALESAVEVLSCKWVPAVLCEIQSGPKRHGDLVQAIGLDAKQLARALHRLNGAGLVIRDVDADRSPPRVRYRLSAAGQALLSPLAALTRHLDAANHPDGVGDGTGGDGTDGVHGPMTNGANGVDRATGVTGAGRATDRPDGS